MKYLIAGGDERAVFAAAALAEAGNSVSALAMDRAQLPPGVKKVFCAENADCVILPLPAEGKSGALNAPFSDTASDAAGLLEALPENTLVCGGKISRRLYRAGELKGLRVTDIMQRPEFVVGNAAITAEAAAAILMQRTDFALFGSSAMVVGYGRIGKILAQRLSALGMRVFVMSRNAESRAMAQAAGCVPLAPTDALPPLEAVINTAPAPVLRDLSRLKKPCLLLELASAPGGIDALEAQRLGHRYFAAPGLPGKYAPRTAGRLIAKTAQQIVKENVHE